MEYIIEKIVMPKKEIYAFNPIEPQKQILDVLTEGYPEKILCDMVSRIINEMESKNYDKH